MTTKTGRRSGEDVRAPETAGGGPEQALSQTPSGPPRPRPAQAIARSLLATALAMELTREELDGLAWAAIHVGASERERAAESALRKLRKIAQREAPQRKW